MKGFIINPSYKVENDKAYVYLYGRAEDGKSFVTKNYYRPYFFIEEENFSKAKEIANFDFEKTKLKSLKRSKKLVKILLNVPKEISEFRKLFESNHIECFEADIRFEYRYLIDHNIKGSVNIIGKSQENGSFRTDYFFDEPKLEFCQYTPSNLKVLSIDIETSMKGKFYCVSLVSKDKELEEVLILKKKGLKNAINFESEKELFEHFKSKINDYDPDVITGWNVIDFDLKYIKKRFEANNLSFDLTRDFSEASLTLFSDFLTDSKADLKGRVVLDGIHLLKSSFISLPDYKLSTASKKYCDSSKLIGEENKGEEIQDAYKVNPQKLVDYNLLDSKLVLEILNKSGVFNLTIKRSILTGMSLDRVRASIASFDSLYLPNLRKKGFVANCVGFNKSTEKTTGGFVMNPKPGIYDFVGVFDFKSLYPSIMRTFNIDPLSLNATKNYLTAPNNVKFSRERSILPNILENLAKERELATKNKDLVARGAIKILMSSMYGVLASPNCRFYSFEMANAITSFGHMLIKKTSDIANKKGLKAIYGDTDSVFLDLKVKSVLEGEKISKQFEEEINIFFTNYVKKEYDMSSVLEIEFEKLFTKFFMPKVRGSDAGAKKRYAGLLKGEIEFTGLEFVRRDWTKVSKKFQLELLEKVFKEEKIENYIKEFVNKLKNGEYDDLLVYRKALRKSLSSYTKTTPPHVKAARKLDKLTTNIIDYVITIEGPEPLEKVRHSIDYDHYINKQIKPLAESVLYFFDKTFDDVLKGSSQTSLGSF